MEKISDFRILELTVSGFKGFAERRTFAFDSGVNFVLGDNAQGKTSLAEAIAYAFMGTGFFGEKTLDRLQNKDAAEVFVSVKFADADGELHELSRTRKNNATAVCYDGYAVRQTDLCGLFGDKDLFLSMFNPLYFAETLGTDGKQLLERLLPAVSHETVLAALPEQVCTALQEESLLSPEVYIKNRRAEIRELEEDLIYLQGQADLLADGAKQAKTALAQAQAEWTKKKAELEKWRSSSSSDGEKDYSQEKSTEYRTEQGKNNLAEQDWEQAAHLQDALTSRLLDTKLRLYQAREQAFVFPEEAELLRLEAELQLQYSRYDTLNKQLQGLCPGLRCITCRHELSEDDASAAAAECRHALAQCAAEGKRRKAALHTLQERKAAAQSAFHDAKAAAIAGLEATLADLEIQSHSLTERRKAAYANRLQPGMAGENPQQTEKIQILQQEIGALEGEIARLTEILQQPDRTEQLAAVRAEIERKKELVGYALCYQGKRNALLFSPLRMNRVQLVLTEVVKGTGEVKDTFKFTYDGREYTRLSLSERLRAALELAELVKRLSGRRYPTFVDNGESISVIDNVRPEGQLMIAKVVKDRPLTILSRSSKRKAA